MGRFNNRGWTIASKAKQRYLIGQCSNLELIKGQQVIMSFSSLIQEVDCLNGHSVHFYPLTVQCNFTLHMYAFTMSTGLLLSCNAHKSRQGNKTDAGTSACPCSKGDIGKSRAYNFSLPPLPFCFLQTKNVIYCDVLTTWDNVDAAHFLGFHISSLHITQREGSGFFGFAVPQWTLVVNFPHFKIWWDNQDTPFSAHKCLLFHDYQIKALL